LAGRLCTSRAMIGTRWGWDGTRRETAVRPVNRRHCLHRFESCPCHTTLELRKRGCRVARRARCGLGFPSSFPPTDAAPTLAAFVAPLNVRSGDQLGLRFCLQVCLRFITWRPWHGRTCWMLALVASPAGRRLASCSACRPSPASPASSGLGVCELQARLWSSRDGSLRHRQSGSLPANQECHQRTP
jgi:hypothetical protein